MKELLESQTADQPIYRAAFEDLRLIRVLLRLVPQSVVIEVWDSSTEPPEPSLGASPGLSRSHDWSYHLPRNGGRVVWFLLPTLEARPDDTVQFPVVLPRRIPRHAAGRPAEIMRDPVVLQRVLDGLKGLTLSTEQED